MLSPLAVLFEKFAGQRKKGKKKLAARTPSNIIGS
jgi:hypothetical protein